MESCPSVETAIQQQLCHGLVDSQCTTHTQLFVVGGHTDLLHKHLKGVQPEATPYKWESPPPLHGSPSPLQEPLLPVGGSSGMFSPTRHQDNHCTWAERQNNLTGHYILFMKLPKRGIREPSSETKGEELNVQIHIHNQAYINFHYTIFVGQQCISS